MNGPFRDFRRMRRRYRRIKRNVRKFERLISSFVNLINRSKPSQNYIRSIQSQRYKRSLYVPDIPVDDMTGEQFENYLVDLYNDLGYRAEKTKATGDFGADIILKSNDTVKIIQAKRYASRVGVRAVQEISSAKNYYNADQTVVVTNNYFTDSAKKLAKINNVRLIDRNTLYKLINKRKEMQNSKEVE